MTEPKPIRIIPHAPAGIPNCGSFEVRFADGRASTYFYWDDDPSRRAVTHKMTQDEAKRAAQDLARTELGKMTRRP